MPAKVTGFARSPTRAFPGFTGQTPSALTPTGILPTSSVSRTQPLMMTPCRKTWGLSVSGLHSVLRVSHMYNRHESSCASPLGVSQPNHSCAALPQDSHQAQRRAYDLRYGIVCALQICYVLRRTAQPFWCIFAASRSPSRAQRLDACPSTINTRPFPASSRVCSVSSASISCQTLKSAALLMVKQCSSPCRK
jgi:hypothetical protein